ncbi:MAG TPA: hypothetical protein VLX92_12405 [Kofleriaceae bacterium]|nr:hypothetical protein [Kofleriaceae bacterium]
MVSLTLASAPALADPGAHAAVEFRSLDMPCRTLDRVPDDARVLTPTLAAEISVADCTALVRARALVLGPTRASYDALETAVEPAVIMLDTVIRVGDVQSQIIAEHAKADLYQGLAVRLLSSVPPISPMTAGAAAIAHQQLVDRANELVAPWRERAMESYRAAAALGSKVPDLVNTNPVVAFAVGDSQFEQPGVASR